MNLKHLVAPLALASVGHLDPSQAGNGQDASCHPDAIAAHPELAANCGPTGPLTPPNALHIVKDKGGHRGIDLDYYKLHEVPEEFKEMVAQADVREDPDHLLSEEDLEDKDSKVAPKKALKMGGYKASETSGEGSEEVGGEASDDEWEMDDEMITSEEISKMSPKKALKVYPKQVLEMSKKKGLNGDDDGASEDEEADDVTVKSDGNLLKSPDDLLNADSEEDDTLTYAEAQRKLSTAFTESRKRLADLMDDQVMLDHGRTRADLVRKHFKQIEDISSLCVEMTSLMIIFIESHKRMLDYLVNEHRSTADLMKVLTEIKLERLGNNTPEENEAQFELDDQRDDAYYDNLDEEEYTDDYDLQYEDEVSLEQEEDTAAKPKVKAPLEPILGPAKNAKGSLFASENVDPYRGENTPQAVN